MNRPTDAELIEFFEKSRRHHYYCEDSWYSCPKAIDGCANPDDGDECNCGADEWNAQVDKITQRLSYGDNDDAR